MISLISRFNVVSSGYEIDKSSTKGLCRTLYNGYQPRASTNKKLSTSPNTDSNVIKPDNTTGEVISFSSFKEIRAENRLLKDYIEKLEKENQSLKEKNDDLTEELCDLKYHGFITPHRGPTEVVVYKNGCYNCRRQRKKKNDKQRMFFENYNWN
jgi:hypothetical protein